MLHVTVTSPSSKDISFAYPGSTVTIGRHVESDVVLSDPKVSRRHAVITIDPSGRLEIEDLPNTNGTFVDDVRVEGKRELPPSCTLTIGPSTLVVRYEAFTLEDVADETEERFLGTLHERPNDDATRLVYADWLEERGHHARAEYLRLQGVARAVDDASDPRFNDAGKRLAALASSVGAGWRARVAMTNVASCRKDVAEHELGFELVCPKRWDELRPTPENDVRACDVCRRKVFYCTSLDAARDLAQQGACVAVDAGVPPAHGDLAWDADAMVMGRPAPRAAFRGRRLDVLAPKRAGE